MKENNKYTDQEKVDMNEIAEEIKKLSPEEKERIFYMIKGAALVSGPAEMEKEPAIKAM